MSCPFANSKYGGCGCHEQKYGGGKKKKSSSSKRRSRPSVASSTSSAPRQAAVTAIAAIKGRQHHRAATKRYERKKGIATVIITTAPPTTTKKAAKTTITTSSRRHKSQSNPNNPVRFRRLIEASDETKKYCSCVAKTAAKQSRECLKHIASGGDPKDITGCYNPYALCGKIKPKNMETGCATLYDYDSMPKNLVSSLAALKGKTMKEMINKASAEIATLKGKKLRSRPPSSSSSDKTTTKSKNPTATSPPAAKKRRYNH